jgi:hypothetical protein
MHERPGAISAPRPEVMIDDLPRRQIMGQQTPRTTAAEDRKNRVQDFALRIFLGSPTRPGGRDQRLNQHPLSVTEVGRVRFAGFHTPMVPEVGRLTQAF